MLMNYLLAHETQLPPIDPANMFEFVIAGNGVFVRARREELEAMIPVSRCGSGAAGSPPLCMHGSR